MQIVNTSDGIVIFGMIDSGSQEETWLNHDEILKMAETSPNKQIIISDHPAYLINDENYINLISEGQPENITFSAELWNKLKIDNFSKIRKSALHSELGNIIGTGEDTIERAKTALELLSPLGMEDVKIDHKNGKEEIVANVDGKECIINVSIGRSSDAKEENVIYDGQIDTNIRLTITSEEDKNYFNLPNKFEHRDGITYKKVYEDNKKGIYIPEKFHSYKSIPYEKVKRDPRLSNSVAEKFKGYDIVKYGLANMEDNIEVISEEDNYAVIIDGEINFHISGSKQYESYGSKLIDCQFITFPSLTISK